MVGIGNHNLLSKNKHLLTALIFVKIYFICAQRKLSPTLNEYLAAAEENNFMNAKKVITLPFFFDSNL